MWRGAPSARVGATIATMTDLADATERLDTDAYHAAARSFLASGIAVFPPTSAAASWAQGAREAAYSIAKRPDRFRSRADGTWVEGYLGPEDGLAPFRGTAVDFLERALGSGPLLFDRAQISVVLHGYPRGEDWHVLQRTRHVDGAVADDRLMLHAAVCGVLLTDLDATDRGNPMAWEGSHHVTAAQLRRIAPLGDVSAIAVAIRRGLPVDEDLCPPRQVIGKAGTAFVYHQGLQHGMAAYDGPPGAPRPVLYFRPGRSTKDPRFLLDPIGAWPGLVAGPG